MFIFIKNSTSTNLIATQPSLLNLNPSLSVFKNTLKFWNKNNCKLNSFYQHSKTIHNHFPQSTFLKTISVHHFLPNTFLKTPSFKSNYSVITCHLIHWGKLSTPKCIYLKSSYYNTKPTTHPTKFNSLPLPVFKKNPKNSRIKTILHQSLFNLNPSTLVI